MAVDKLGGNQGAEIATKHSRGVQSSRSSGASQQSALRSREAARLIFPAKGAENGLIEWQVWPLDC